MIDCCSIPYVCHCLAILQVDVVTVDAGIPDGWMVRRENCFKLSFERHQLFPPQGS